MNKLKILIGIFFLLTACSNTTTNVDASTARSNLGTAYLEDGNFEKAKQNFEKALAHNPNNYLAHLGLAFYFQNINDLKLAESHYQKAIKLSNNNFDIKSKYAKFLCQNERFNAAYQNFEKLLQNSSHLQSVALLEQMLQCASNEANNGRYSAYFLQLKSLSPNQAEQIKNKIHNHQQLIGTANGN